MITNELHANFGFSALEKTLVTVELKIYRADEWKNNLHSLKTLQLYIVPYNSYQCSDTKLYIRLFKCPDGMCGSIVTRYFVQN